MADVVVVAETVRSRRRDWVEASVGYGLILLVIWTPRPWQRLVYWAPVLWIAGATWLSFESGRSMGWRTTNFVRSAWVVGIAASMAAVTVLVSARMGTLHAPPGPVAFFHAFIGYAIWSFVQQFLMLDFFLGRMMRLMPGRVAVVVTAGIFALAHIPNPVLAPLTLVWGLAACVIFLKYRNLWTLGMAHAVFGICVAVSLPARVTHNMRVGLGYWGFRVHHHRRNSDHIVSMQAWVTEDAATRLSARQARP
jgi:membrane protease YdiL (CAAX protease family)